VLPVDRADVDAVRFERILRAARDRAAEGDVQAAEPLFREALELWRGPVLGWLPFMSLAQSEVDRLEEERLAALMERIDCDLGLGRHEQLVGELEGLVSQHPLRERLRGQLMLALYRSGRQVDALRVYRDGRETLVEELGLEPSEPLQRLERAILVHDPALEAPTGIARPRVTARPESTHVPTGHRWPPSRRLAAVAALALAAVAIAIAVTASIRTDERAAVLLEPNSVGLIDAGSGRITRWFPVGREPLALAVAYDSLWVANYGDEAVSRIDRGTGRSIASFDVGGHPTAIAAYRGTVWVWTFEGSLTEIDPRFNRVHARVRLDVATPVAALFGSDPAARRRQSGSIVACSGFLWVTIPTTTVLRLSPASPKRSRKPIPLDDGAQGPIACRGDELWVGGFSQVSSIDARTLTPGSGTDVGRVRDLAFADNTLWVLSGFAGGAQGVAPALRPLDLRGGRLPHAVISVGAHPVAVATAAGSIWAADSDGTVTRVDPVQNRVIDTISVGSSPTDLAADGYGVWVAVR
jgi:hypothetical protein